jgi:N-methylhydantoinase A
LPYRLGVDTGGTFTDLALIDEATGTLRLFKLPSTPADPSEAIAEGMAAILAENGVAPDAVRYLGHGTTVATNAVIEGKVARAGLITTRGFRDIIELARQRRPHLYDLDVEKPRPLIPRHLRREIDERMRADGTVLRPVAPAQVEAIVGDFRREGVAAVAVCFLHAYANDAHEREVEALVRRAWPEAWVCTSSRVLAEFREFERFSSTIMNVALMPGMSGYLRRLQEATTRMRLGAPVHLMQSNGGVMSAAAAEERPVATLFSGPSAGVIGAAHVAGLADLHDLVTFDMGGTSTDVCLVAGGAPAIASERQVAGFPLKTPMLDVHSVGAGGGSIGWIDAGGFLKVGPRSAGARPGPACYGAGGIEPTVTDANVVLGRLSPEYLLGGRMRVDRDAAARAIQQHVADPLRLGLAEAARGMIRVVNVNMMRAIRVISVEKGSDPRQFALVAFGGAGPLHAAQLAKDLGMSRVLVPESPGLLCAIGLLVADVRADFSRTRVMETRGADLKTVNEILQDLRDQAAAWLTREKISALESLCEWAIDMRYVGQDFELPVPAMPGPIAEPDLRLLADRFHAAHERAYGYRAPQAATEMVSFRLVLRSLMPKPVFPRSPAGRGDASGAVRGGRLVFFEEAGDFVPCPIYDRGGLRAGNRLRGPAVIEQMDATTVVHPGQEAHVDEYRNIHILIGETGSR